MPLANDVGWLHGQIELYRTLYDSAESRALLHKVATVAFALINDGLLTAIVVAFGRLTDGARSAGKPVLSLVQFGDVLRNYGQAPVLSVSFDKRVAAIRARLQPLKELRHKTAAHRDLATALSGSIPVLPLQPNELQATVTQIGDMLNEVSEHYTGGVWDFGRYFEHGSGNDLLAMLRLGFDTSLEDHTREWIVPPPMGEI